MANTNTLLSSPVLDNALTTIPAKFRLKIIAYYLEIKKRFNQSMYDSSYEYAGLSAGKFSETVLRFLQQELTGTHVPFNKHIQNFADEARKLVQLPSAAGEESLRTIIPRALVFLYTLRGKRGIGHVGGDIDANGIDTMTIVRVSDWIICELVRIYNNLPIEDAQNIIDTLSSRSLPDIWEIGGKKRILRDDLDYKQKVLLLAYSEAQTGVMVEDLFNWTEYSNLSVFKKKVLLPLHQQRWIEYDQETEFIFLSPLGIKEVEEHILHNLVMPASKIRQ
jgi:hypothetical protein